MTATKLFTAIDDAADGVFDRIRGNRIADQIFYWLSFVAEFSILWQIIALVGLAPFSDLRDQWLRLVIILLIESVLVNQVIKRITNRARPNPTDKLTTRPRRPSTTSLPSGHASSATLAAILLSIALPQLTALFVVLAVLVAASRIHNRVHHASDVLAGVVTGFVFAGAALLLF